jgi:ABC-type transporter Mla MlaB component
MLRITVHQEVHSIALLIEGKLMGDWVDELRKVWSSIRWMHSNEGAIVDLSSVLGVDISGRHLLAEIHSTGGVLVGTGLLARTLIQEITGSAT